MAFKNKLFPLLKKGIQKVLDLSKIVEYESDLSASYTNRTLVDKEYIDNLSYSHFDATVGIGGDYATHALAFASGRRRVRQISDVTETADTGITGDYFIEGGGYELTCNYRFITSGNLTMNNITFTTNYVGAYHLETIKVIDLIITNSIINLNNATDSFMFSCNYIYFNNVTINPSDVDVRIKSARGIIEQVTVNLVETANRYLFFADDTTFENVIFTGTIATPSWNLNTLIKGDSNIFKDCSATTARFSVYGQFNKFYNCDNVFFTPKLPSIISGGSSFQGHYKETWGVTRINNCDSIELVAYNSTVTLNYEVLINNTNLTFTSRYGSWHNVFAKKFNMRGGSVNGTGVEIFNSGANFTNVEFTNAIETVKNDAVTYNNCVMQGVTIDATADKTTLIGCRTLTSIVDYGTNTQLIANNLI